MKNKKTWLYVGIGVVVLLVVYRFVMNRTWYLDFSESNNLEEKAGAGGGKDCDCVTPWGTIPCESRCKKCARDCQKAINVQTM